MKEKIKKRVLEKFGTIRKYSKLAKFDERDFNKRLLSIENSASRLNTGLKKLDFELILVPSKCPACADKRWIMTRRGVFTCVSCDHEWKL